MHFSFSESFLRLWRDFSPKRFRSFSLTSIYSLSHSSWKVGHDPTVWLWVCCFAKIPICSFHCLPSHITDWVWDVQIPFLLFSTLQSQELFGQVTAFQASALCVLKRIALVWIQNLYERKCRKLCQEKKCIWY